MSDFCQWTRRHRIFKRIPVGIALKSSWLHLMSFLVVRFSLHILNGCTMMWRNLRDMHNNISSVMEFQRRWVLKSKIFSQESTYLMEIFFKKSIDELWFIKKCQNCTFIQGQSRQTAFFELALRDRNVQVRFCFKKVLKSWDAGNFATVTCFYDMHTVSPL